MPGYSNQLALAANGLKVQLFETEEIIKKNSLMQSFV